MKAHHINLIAVIYLFCLIIHLTFYYSSRDGGPTQKLLIQSGLSNKSIALETKKSGLISSSTLFLVYLFLSDQNRLIAGSYFFEKGESISQIGRKIAEGHFYRVKVTFPEGSTVNQMSTWLERAGICSKEEYLNITRQAQLFQRSWLSGIKNLEGYLFPDTYYFPLVTDPRQVVEAQLKRFEEVYPGKIQEESPQETYKKVILASIVEREARAGNEKPVVASVFLNRLKTKMRLESCATVIYAWNHEKGIQLTTVSLDDLTIQSPYNTYIHQGLPPTPICNPGLDSLRAAVEPSQTDYYYFVLGENGSHRFSRTFDEHLKNKKKSINE